MRIETRLPRHLPIPALQHAVAHSRRPLARRRLEPCLLRRPQTDIKVDAVQQGAGEALPIRFDARLRADARLARVSRPAARTRIHGGHQLKLGGKGGAHARPSDADATCLQWLSQRLQNRTVEFWKLIQKQYAMMREA